MKLNFDVFKLYPLFYLNTPKCFINRPKDSLRPLCVEFVGFLHVFLFLPADVKACCLSRCVAMWETAAQGRLLLSDSWDILQRYSDP